ncbi:arylamine N-acetyltransferase family protein [Lunatimonas salinarum]|uniref:arylamine N-acetyltransferase family protein n=1 Tax=Lunatimonas salinarum TaxID=1774590 RepID=UPI001ADF63C2|nr:arylamine N-acetyltransferase [Lunatimonas salinarum]
MDNPQIYHSQSPFFYQISDKELSDYLLRIGFDAAVSPSLACLERLHVLHPQSIPFETLNPFLGIPVLLDTTSLWKKLVYQGRGGYCFEQNLLFGAVLRKIGFQVKSLAARVLWQLPAGKVMPRDHMVLLVSLAGKEWLVDVGWGGNTLPKPLLLEEPSVQCTSHEPFRLIKSGGLYVLSIEINGRWEEMHEFGKTEFLLPDYDVISWYLCHHPESLFVNHLMAARTLPSGRITLKDNLFSTHTTNGETQKTLLQSPAEIEEVLRERFGINLPNNPHLVDKLSTCIYPIA